MGLVDSKNSHDSERSADVRPELATCASRRSLWTSSLCASSDNLQPRLRCLGVADTALDVTSWIILAQIRLNGWIDRPRPGPRRSAVLAMDLGVSLRSATGRTLRLFWSCIQFAHPERDCHVESV